MILTVICGVIAAGLFGLAGAALSDYARGASCLFGALGLFCGVLTMFSFYEDALDDGEVKFVAEACENSVVFGDEVSNTNDTQLRVLVTNAVGEIARGQLNDEQVDAAIADCYEGVKRSQR